MGPTAETVEDWSQMLTVQIYLVLKCPKNPATGKPETTAFRVIKGKNALYSVQRAWRSVPSDKEIDEVMHALAKVTVCDTRTADHPCPSFDSLVARP